jgi:hypothetical protein
MSLSKHYCFGIPLHLVIGSELINKLHTLRKLSTFRLYSYYYEVDIYSLIWNISNKQLITYSCTSGNMKLKLFTSYIHTYHSRFIPEGVAEVTQIFLRDTYVLPKLVSYEEHCRRDRW